jgi:DNA-binding NarL/FixJ family response regulator
MKIVIADDSIELRERLVEMVSELSVIEIVGQAKDTVGAIESISSLKPDLVILDIKMAGGSGIEVLKKIKKDYPSILVIMFTNYPTTQYRNRCLDLGADFFLDKSTEYDEIPHILSRLTQYSQNE